MRSAKAERIICEIFAQSFKEHCAYSLYPYTALLPSADVGILHSDVINRQEKPFPSQRSRRRRLFLGRLAVRYEDIVISGSDAADADEQWHTERTRRRRCCCNDIINSSRTAGSWSNSTSDHTRYGATTT